MPSRRTFRCLFTFCLLCLFSLQALAAAGMQNCRHARPARASQHEHHQHHAGMAMSAAMAHQDHGAAKDFPTGCGCGCADRHCAGTAPGLSAANPAVGIVALRSDATAAVIAATQLRDAHDRDLIRPPSFI